MLNGSRPSFGNGTADIELDDSEQDSHVKILSRFQPPALPPAPNFFKFKVGDVTTLLESSSLADLVLCLSSDNKPNQLQASSAIQHLMIKLQTSTFAESEMCYLLLGELVDTHQEVSRAENKLPYLVSTFAAHAIPILMDPTHTMYAKIAAFLTIKPSWHPSRLVRHFIENIVLAQPSEEGDVAPWKEIDWLLDWLYDGLRTPLDGDILRKVASWEALGSLGAHPALGSSKARNMEGELGNSRLQNRVRGKIVKLIGRALHIGQAAVLVTGQEDWPGCRCG